MNCPLCKSESILDYYKSKTTNYVQCSNCTLVFVPRDILLSMEEEKARYELHDNSIANSGYVKYLSKIVDKIESLNLKKLNVLDFGSGKNAVLQKILSQKKIMCSSYDPVYNLGNSFLKSSYNVIVVCEVIEHVYDIYKELKLLFSLIENGGYIILRTELLLENLDFSSWWYKEDITHVNFFTHQSIEKLAEIIGGKIIDYEKNTIVIKA